MYRYLYDSSFEWSSDESSNSSYESDEESDLNLSDFEKLDVPSTSDAAEAIPGQICSLTNIKKSETAIDENKTFVKPRKKERNLGILSHIKQVRKMVFHRQSMLESSHQCTFRVIKREERMRQSPESKSSLSKDKSPSSSLIERRKKYGKYNEPQVSSSSEDRSPLSLKGSKKKNAKRPSKSKSSPSKYVSLSSSENYSTMKKTTKISSQDEISPSKCTSPSSASKERKKKYRKERSEPKPSTSKHLSSPSSPSSSSSSSFVEENFEYYSNLPVRERSRKFCAEFLQFQRLCFNNLKATENKLILSMNILDSVVKKCMKLCMKSVDFRNVSPETKEHLEYENNSLLYMIGKSASIFEELNRHVKEMTKEINQFIKETDKAFQGSAFLLENAMFTILFFLL